MNGIFLISSFATLLIFMQLILISLRLCMCLFITYFLYKWFTRRSHLDHTVYLQQYKNEQHESKKLTTMILTQKNTIKLNLIECIKLSCGNDKNIGFSNDIKGCKSIFIFTPVSFTHYSISMHPTRFYHKTANPLCNSIQVFGWHFIAFVGKGQVRRSILSYRSLSWWSVEF